MSLRILVVDSNDEFVIDSVQSIEGFGLNVTGASTVAEMDQQILKSSYDILVLSNELTGESGLSVLQRIRKAHPNMGVVYISEVDELSSRILALQLGADSYLTRPVNTLELISVIESLARRLKLLMPNNDPFWMLDRHKMEFRFLDPEEAVVELTSIEAKLLSSFAISDSGMVEKERLVLALGEDPELYDIRRLEAAISRLRRKVCAAHPEKSDCIKSVRNRGYQFLSRIKILS